MHSAAIEKERLRSQPVWFSMSVACNPRSLACNSSLHTVMQYCTHLLPMCENGRRKPPQLNKTLHRLQRTPNSTKHTVSVGAATRHPLMDVCLVAYCHPRSLPAHPAPSPPCAPSGTPTTLAPPALHHHGSRGSVRAAQLAGSPLPLRAQQQPWPPCYASKNPFVPLQKPRMTRTLLPGLGMPAGTPLLVLAPVWLLHTDSAPLHAAASLHSHRH